MYKELQNNIIKFTCDRSFVKNCETRTTHTEYKSKREKKCLNNRSFICEIQTTRKENKKVKKKSEGHNKKCL